MRLKNTLGLAIGSLSKPFGEDIEWYHNRVYRVSGKSTYGDADDTLLSMRWYSRATPNRFERAAVNVVNNGVCVSGYLVYRFVTFYDQKDWLNPTEWFFDGAPIQTKPGVIKYVMSDLYGTPLPAQDTAVQKFLKFQKQRYPERFRPAKQKASLETLISGTSGYPTGCHKASFVTNAWREYKETIFGTGSGMWASRHIDR